MHKLLMAVVLLVSASIAFAQQSDPCGCNAVLLNGVYNYRAARGDSDAKAELEMYVARTSYEEFRAAQGFKAGISIAGFGLDAGTSREQYERRQAQYRTQHRNWSSTVTSQQLLEKYGDLHVLGSWSQCKATCNMKGLQSWVTVTDSKNVVVILQWNPWPNAVAPQVTSSTISGGRVADPAVPVGQVFAGAQILPIGDTKIPVVRQDSSIAVVLSIKVPGMDVYEYIPPYRAPLEETPHLPAGSLDFDNDGKPDTYFVAGNGITVQLGAGKAPLVTTPSGDYDVTAGPWFEGDFNGDRKLDLAHIVVRRVDQPGYVHVFFGDGTGRFLPPPKFSFVENANPQHEYDTSLGHWTAADYDGDGRTDLIHNPELADRRIHRWRSRGNGSFEIH